VYIGCGLRSEFCPQSVFNHIAKFYVDVAGEGVVAAVGTAFESEVD
jgi:hypothetical protein